MHTRNREMALVVIMIAIVVTVDYAIRRRNQLRYASDQHCFDREFDIMKTHYRETA